MSTVRIQVRRGTASQWSSINPILAAGEMGLESDTNFIKFGDGTHAWSDLSYANEPLTNIQNALADYVPVADMGVANGVATLNSSGKIPSDQLDSSAFTELAQDAVANAVNVGSGLNKVYDDAGNTLTISPDTDILASKSFVAATYVPEAALGAANGVATLNSDSHIPNSQIDETVWARKFQIDAAVAGINIKASVRATSTQNFASARTAGTADQSGGYGIGEKLTASANGALLIDGVSLAVGDRVLLKDQTDGKQNGVYEVTNAGGSSTKAILTRTADMNNSIDGEVKVGDFVFTTEGTNNQRDGFVVLSGASRSGSVFQLGTDSLVFTQFTGAIPVQIADGLKKIGDVVLVDFDVAATKASVDGLAATESSARAGIVTRLDGHDTTITAITAKDTAQDASISSLNTTVASHTSTIASHTSTLASIATTNTSQDSAISGLGSRLTTAEANLTTQASNITDVTTSVTTLNTNLRNDLAPKAGATFTGTITLPTTTSIGLTTASELGYVHGVTSSIQPQIDAKLSIATAASTYATITSDNLKAPLASPTFTGTVSGITKAMVGLGSVDNTADSAKPVSTAQQTALDLKAPLASPTFTGTVTGVTKAMVGLGNVDNTSDASKPVSTATQTALDAKLASATAATTYAPIASPTFTGTVAGITKSMVGLGNVDNTSDASKPVSTATQTALDAKLASATAASTYETIANVALKAPLASPELTGTPTAPTAAAGTNTTQIATTAFVGTAVSNLVAAAPAALDTLNELATALGNDANFSTTITSALAAKAPTASPTFTGTVSGITKSMVGLSNVDNTADTAKPISTATQTALDAKLASATAATTYAPIASPTFTGTVTLPTGTVTSGMILDGTIVNADINASAAIAATKIAGTAITAADTGTVTSTMILDGTIVNADINASAAIATSKIAGLDTALTAKAPLASPTFTGTVTLGSGGVTFADGTTSTTQGVPSITTIGTQISANTTLSSGLKDQMIPVAGTVNITIPTNASVAYPVGVSIDFYQASGSLAAFVAASGVTFINTPGLKMRATGSVATAMKVATDTWLIFGDLTA